MTTQDRMETRSLAYVTAVAAEAGLTYSVRRDYGIDLSLHEVEEVDGRYGETGFALDFQVKSTTAAVLAADVVTFRLEVKNYNDLRRPDVIVPRIHGGDPRSRAVGTSRRGPTRTPRVCVLAVAGRRAGGRSEEGRQSDGCGSAAEPLHARRDPRDNSGGEGSMREHLMAKIFSEDQLRAVTVASVRDHFGRFGWMPTELARGGLLFRNSAGAGTYFFPDSDSYYDYPLRVEDLLVALSKMEDRPLLAVWQELAKQPLASTAEYAAKNGATT